MCAMFLMTREHCSDQQLSDSVPGAAGCEEYFPWTLCSRQPGSPTCQVCNFFFFKFIYFEEEIMQARGRERRRERNPSRLCAVSAEPYAGLELSSCEIVT